MLNFFDQKCNSCGELVETSDLAYLGALDPEDTSCSRSRLSATAMIVVRQSIASESQKEKQMENPKFRIPHRCQNGHFRWLFFTLTNGFDNCRVWGPLKNECRCPTINFGEGFKKSDEALQFTGLKDINGADVYEGDVLQIEGFYSGDHWQEAQKVVVKYYDGGFEVFNKEEYVEALWEALVNLDGLIIGNIHESPELLEGLDHE